MDRKEIERISGSLLENTKIDKAYFKIDEYSEGEYFISANKDGFLLYAIQMLNASIVNNGSKIFGINDGSDWLDNSIISVDYAKLINETKDEIVHIKIESNLKDTLISYVFYFGIIVFIICGIVGGISIFNKIVGLF